MAYGVVFVQETDMLPAMAGEVPGVKLPRLTLLAVTEQFGATEAVMLNEAPTPTASAAPEKPNAHAAATATANASLFICFLLFCFRV